MNNDNRKWKFHSIPQSHHHHRHQQRRAQCCTTKPPKLNTILLSRNERKYFDNNKHQREKNRRDDCHGTNKKNRLPFALSSATRHHHPHQMPGNIQINSISHPSNNSRATKKNERRNTWPTEHSMRCERQCRNETRWEMVRLTVTVSVVNDDGKRLLNFKIENTQHKRSSRACPVHRERTLEQRRMQVDGEERFYAAKAFLDSWRLRECNTRKRKQKRIRLGHCHRRRWHIHCTQQQSSRI